MPLTQELEEAEESETVAGVVEVTVGGGHAARVTQVLSLLTPLKRIQVQHTAAGTRVGLTHTTHSDEHTCRVDTDSTQ